jgi:hypothetical protein
MRDKIKVGDLVVSLKGCRFKGPPGVMKVISTGSKWRDYNQVVCLKPNGRKSRFLEKNLRVQGC